MIENVSMLATFQCSRNAIEIERLLALCNVAFLPTVISGIVALRLWAPRTPTSPTQASVQQRSGEKMTTEIAGKRMIM